MYGHRTLIALLAGLTCSSAASAACKMSQVGSFSVEVVDGRILVPSSVNGHDLKFVIGTSWNLSSILPSAAASLGLGVSGTRAEAISTTRASAPVGVVYVEDLVIGGLKAHGIGLAAVGSEENFGSPDAVAILGRDILKEFDIEFDLKHGKVNLFKPEGCENANLAYWSDSYNVVDLLFDSSQTGGMAFTAQVNGKPLRTVLSSSSNHSYMDFDTAEALGVSPGSPGVRQFGAINAGAADKIDNWVGTFQDFTLDAEVIKPVSIQFHRFPKSPAGRTTTGTNLPVRRLGTQLFLGSDFISAHRIYLSQLQRKMYFTYAGGVPFKTDGTDQRVREPEDQGRSSGE